MVFIKFTQDSSVGPHAERTDSAMHHCDTEGNTIQQGRWNHDQYTKEALKLADAHLKARCGTKVILTSAIHCVMPLYRYELQI